MFLVKAQNSNSSWRSITRTHRKFFALYTGILCNYDELWLLVNKYKERKESRSIPYVWAWPEIPYKCHQIAMDEVQKFEALKNTFMWIT